MHSPRHQAISLRLEAEQFYVHGSHWIFTFLAPLLSFVTLALKESELLPIFGQDPPNKPHLARGGGQGSSVVPGLTQTSGNKVYGGYLAPGLVSWGPGDSDGVSHMPELVEET